jgi:hypothetical protein
VYIAQLAHVVAKIGTLDALFNCEPLSSCSA